MNIVRNAFEAQTQAYDHGEKMRQDRARVQAGRQMERGGPQAAAGVLYEAGDLQGGAGMQQMQQQGQEREQKLQQAESAKKLEFMKRMGVALQGIPMEQRAQVYQERVGPALQSLGMKPEDVASAGSHLDDASLATFIGEMDKHLQVVNRGNGAYDVVDTNTGNATRSVAPYPEYKEFDPTKNVMDVSGGGQPPTGGGAPNFDRFFSQYLAPAEGGYAANDGNGQPVNFGINQGSNPDVDVSKLTQDQAKQITLERYWKPSGADKL